MITIIFVQEIVIAHTKISNFDVPAIIAILVSAINSSLKVVCSEFQRVYLAVLAVKSYQLGYTSAIPYCAALLMSAIPGC